MGRIGEMERASEEGDTVRRGKIEKERRTSSGALAQMVRRGKIEKERRTSSGALAQMVRRGKIEKEH